MYDCPHQGPFEPLRVDSIFNASAGIGGQPDIFIGLERGDAFNQSYGSNRDQVVLITVGGVILFGRLKRKEEFDRLKTTPQGPPNFKWISK